MAPRSVWSGNYLQTPINYRCLRADVSSVKGCLFVARRAGPAGKVSRFQGKKPVPGEKEPVPGEKEFQGKKSWFYGTMFQGKEHGA